LTLFVEFDLPLKIFMNYDSFHDLLEVHFSNLISFYAVCLYALLISGLSAD
jgi:hypothetical protein